MSPSAQPAMGGEGGHRDRDAAGRARNARPRDAQGRPLPHGSTAADGAVVPVPDELALTPDETVAAAQRLLDEGRPFAAHEVLEAAWKSAPDHERALWQGLAQVCVGLTHLQRGNARGAARLLLRGVERITAYSAEPPYDLDVAGVITHASTVAASAGADPAARPAGRLALRRASAG